MLQFGIVVVGFWLLLGLLKLTFPFLAPFFIGLLLALFIDIPVSHLESRGISRTFPTLFLTLAMFLGLPILLGTVLIYLWLELRGLIRFAPWIADQLTTFLEGVPWVTPQLGSSNIANFVEMFTRWVLAIPDFFIIWILASFSTYFFCRDKRFFLSIILSNLPQRWEKSFFFLYKDTTRALWHLFRIQLILMTLTSAFSMLFFKLLALPYAIILGLAVGVVDLIPIVGPGLIYGLLALLQLYLRNAQTALALGLAYLILLLVRQFGQPHLVSEGLDLHPVIVIMALYIGFRYWGLLGALVAPVILVFLKAFTTTYSII